MKLVRLSGIGNCKETSISLVSVPCLINFTFPVYNGTALALVRYVSLNEADTRLAGLMEVANDSNENTKTGLTYVGCGGYTKYFPC